MEIKIFLQKINDIYKDFKLFFETHYNNFTYEKKDFILSKNSMGKFMLQFYLENKINSFDDSKIEKHIENFLDIIYDEVNII